MDSSTRARNTRLLREYSRGERSSLDELFQEIYDELRHLAGARLKRLPPGHTLQATALVHEAYLRLVDQKEVSWNDRTHFLAITARLMREVIVDYTRRKTAEKRGGKWGKVTLDDTIGFSGRGGVDCLELEEALEKLEELDPRRARVVELRFYSGMTIQEAATVLRVSPKTVETDWYSARAWLRRELEQRGS